MGGYIAVSIAGRAGLAPGFIATFAAATPSLYLSYADWMGSATINDIVVKQVSLGIVAAIMMGFGAGYLTNLFNRIPTHKNIKPIMPIIVIPVCVTSILVFPFLFGLSGILGCGMD
jgi:PTS system fructose-specific IIC component